MQKITQISLFIIITLLLTAFAPLASAEDYTGKQVEINLEPGEQNDSSIVNNIADTTDTPLEMDQIYSYLPIGTEGKYYGPYLQSSLFQFATSGGYFQFAINLTIGSDVIMNGVSNLWLRIPVQPSQYNWWHTVITWDERVDSIEIGPDKWYNGMSADALYSLATPFKMDDYVYTGSLWPYPGFFIGNYWSSDSTSNELYIETEYGIFLNLKGTFLPDQQFTISFTGQVKDTVSPRVYLTQELFDDDNYSYRFFEFKKLGTTARFTYDYDIELPLAPAFAFVFLSGIGKWGMTAYEIDFNGTQSLSFYGYEYNSLNSTGSTTTGFRYYDLEGYSNATRLSFYMPFTVVANYDEPQNLDIDWLVTLTMRPFNTSIYSYHPWYFLDGLTPTNEVSFYINDTSNYLLFSSPYQIYTPTTVDYCEVILTIKPVQNCTVLFLGNVIKSELDGGGEKILQGSYNNNQKARWDGVTDCNVNQLFPIYNSYSFTNTLWAQVTETQLYDIYDFGWGKGYNIPGETSIYIFLDDGGQYIWNGSYAGFAEEWDDRNEPFSLINTIANAIKNLAGFIWDGITYIWDTLVGIGEFIYNIISSFIDFIVTIAKDVISKVVNLVEGFLYGLPIILTLFVVNYAGQMFQTGHMPVPRKEIRTLKRLKKKVNKTFVKPLGAYRNKLKSEDARNERAVQRASKRYGDASAKGYVRQANAYAKDQNQSRLRSEELANVGRRENEKEIKDQKIWHESEQRAVEKANKKVEKMEAKNAEPKDKEKSKVTVDTNGKQTIEAKNAPLKEGYLHTISREEQKARVDSKGIRKTSKARREFEAMRESDLAMPIVRQKNPETLSQLEIARRRRELERKPDQPKSEVIRKEPKLINDVVREPEATKPKTNGDSLDEMRELLKGKTPAKNNETVILQEQRQKTNEEKKVEQLALEKQGEAKDAEALQRAVDDEYAKAQDKRNQEEYNAEAKKVSEANRKVEAIQKKQADEEAEDRKLQLDRAKEQKAVDEANLKLKAQAIKESNEEYERKMIADGYTKTGNHWSKKLTPEERKQADEEMAERGWRIGETNAMEKANEKVKTKDEQAVMDYHEQYVKDKKEYDEAFDRSLDGKATEKDNEIIGRFQSRPDFDKRLTDEEKARYQQGTLKTNDNPQGMSDEELKAWKQKNAKLIEQANDPESSKDNSIKNVSGKKTLSHEELHTKAESNDFKPDWKRRSVDQVSASNPAYASRTKDNFTNDKCRKCGKKGYVMTDTWMCLECDGKEHGKHDYSRKTKSGSKESKMGYPEIDESKAYENQKKMMAEADEKKMKGEDAKYLRSKGFSEEFIKNGSESDLNRMATIRRDADSARSKLKAHGYSDKEIDTIEQGKDGHKELIKKANRVKKVKADVDKAEKKLDKKEIAKDESSEHTGIMLQHKNTEFSYGRKDEAIKKVKELNSKNKDPDIEYKYKVDESLNPGNKNRIRILEIKTIHNKESKPKAETAKPNPKEVKAFVKTKKAEIKAEDKAKAETAKEIKKDSAKQNSGPEIQLFKYQVKTSDGKTSYTNELAVAKVKAKDNPGSTISESKPGPFNKGNKFYKMKEQKQKSEAPKQAVEPFTMPKTDYKNIRAQFNSITKKKVPMWYVGSGKDSYGNEGKYYLVDNGKDNKLHFESNKELMNKKVSDAPPDVKNNVKAIREHHRNEKKGESQ